MSRAKYPAECPVFSFEGEDVALRPLMGLPNDCVDGKLTVDDFCNMTESGPLSRKAKPLTRAARELLRWSRQ
jgi:hypothetical protein